MTKYLTMNKWFPLPRVGKETFSELMRARVKYDSKFGFMLTSSTSLERTLGILTSALNDQVVLTSACFICEGPLESEETTTLCRTCLANEDVLDIYRLRFIRLVESV